MRRSSSLRAICWLLLLPAGCERLGFQTPRVDAGMADGGPLDGGTEPDSGACPASCTTLCSEVDGTCLPEIVNVTWQGAGGPLVITADTVYDTTVCGPLEGVAGRVESTPNGPDACVVEARTVAVSGRLQVVGGRPFVLLSHGDLRVTELLASAEGTTPGPGGSAPGQGASPGSVGTRVGTEPGPDAGGGGGAHCGNGGSGSGGATGGLGGVVGSLRTTDPTVLAAGSGGADATADLPGGEGRGGASGGVVQIASGTRIFLLGPVRLDGGAGGGGTELVSPMIAAGGGGGGGAGGLLVLEAPAIDAAGVLIGLNGGGGGGSAMPGGGNGMPGEQGDDVGLQRPMGGTAAPGGGQGGSGAGGALVDGESAPTVTATNGGGGGGGGGCFFVRATMLQQPIVTGAVLTAF